MRVDLLPTTATGMLVHLIEECAEVQKAATKILRFGVEATDPKTGMHYDNAAALLDEMVDLTRALAAIKGVSGL